MHLHAAFASILMIALVGCRISFSQPVSQEVDLALILSMDVSFSISNDRFDLQKKGYERAFLSADVQKAISSGPHGVIAVSMVQWSSPGQQNQVVKWTLLRDQKSAGEFADAVMKSSRVFGDETSISGAIDFGVKLFDTMPYDAARQVMDISGDGSDNSRRSKGRPLSNARNDALKNKKITINGLPILGVPEENGLIIDLAQYYRDNVIGGPGAFVEVAENFGSFAGAIHRKLLLEIAGVVPKTRVAHAR